MTAVIEPADPVQIREKPIYSYGNGRSFFQDLALATLRNDDEARRRLALHQEHDTEQRVNPNTTAGTGGEFAPPGWIISEFRTAKKAGRVLGDLVQNLELPAGVSSINIPVDLVGADAAIQTANAAPVTDVDETTANAGGAGNIVTIAGDEDSSIQLLDQTPYPGYDGIMYAALSLGYNQNLEKQMLAGTGINGQLTGLTQVSGITSVSGATISATQDTAAQDILPLVGQAAAGVGNTRQLPPEIVVMSPRRYYAIATGRDTAKRALAALGNRPHPAILPSSLDALSDDELPLAGGARPVDVVAGLPCYLSGGINGAAATVADYILVLRVSNDMLLYESTPKFMVYDDPLSGTLGVRLQLSRYVAFIKFYAASIGAVVNIPQPTNF